MMRVLLLKEAPEDGDDDPYRAALTALLAPEQQLQLSYLPLNECVYDDAAAAAALSAAVMPSADSEGGAAACESVVVTSHRAVTALCRALPLLEPEPELRWKSVKRAFVVGPRTASSVEAELQLPVVPVGGAPKAAALLELIASTLAAEAGGDGGGRGDGSRGGLLRLHSTDRADSLAPQLRGLHPALVVRQAAVYGLAPVHIETIHAELGRLGLTGAGAVGGGDVGAPGGGLVWVVCFSPLRLPELGRIPRPGCAAAPATDDDVEALSSQSWMGGSGVRLVAMGPTTAEVLAALR